MRVLCSGKWREIGGRPVRGDRFWLAYDMSTYK